MKKPVIYIIAVLAATGCGCLKHQPTVITEVKDSIVYRDRIVEKVVTVELPTIIEKNVTDDTLSVIENKYARTAAVVSDGHLWHDLQIKNVSFEVPVTVEVHDTLIVKERAEVKTETIEVEKKLTKFQKSAMFLGEAFMIAIVALMLFIIARIFIGAKGRQ